ncbi:MAG: hypothetical protein R3D58_22375 [Saprospiraceae bacterium]|nr:hypothetical protein [Lewinellaceae bacterium]
MKQIAFPAAHRFVVLSLFLFLYSSCYHYRIMAPDFDPATEYQSKTAHSLFWGLIQSQPMRPANCANSNGLDEVRVSTNFGYALITVATLGIWCPVQLEWRCAKPCTPAPDSL